MPETEQGRRALTMVGNMLFNLRQPQSRFDRDEIISCLADVEAALRDTSRAPAEEVEPPCPFCGAPDSAGLGVGSEPVDDRNRMSSADLIEAACGIIAALGEPGDDPIRLSSWPNAFAPEAQAAVRRRARRVLGMLVRNLRYAVGPVSAEEVGAVERMRERCAREAERQMNLAAKLEMEAGEGSIGEGRWSLARVVLRDVAVSIRALSLDPAGQDTGETGR